MKKADFILIGAVVCVALLIGVILYFAGNNGAYAEVEVDGKVVETLPLGENTTYEISTENGTNTLVIEDGCAYMADADCPDLICVKHRKISKKGESIICLPHKVIVTVVGGDDAEADL